MRLAWRVVNCLTIGKQVVTGCGHLEGRAEWGVSGQNSQGPGQQGAAPRTYEDGELASVTHS